jgi:hypothetical protein
VQHRAVPVLHSLCVPTTQPRYTITDTGPLRTLLDDAQRHWPEVHGRKELLLALAQAGHESLGLSALDPDAARRLERQADALSRLTQHVDWDAISDDQPWR